jgi:exonuclease III
MYTRPKFYSREDILHYKSNIKDSSNYEVCNYNLLATLSWQANIRKPTKRGSRGRKRNKHNGKKHHARGVVQSNLIAIPTITNKADNQDVLPSVFYTNVRSLSIWKLEELLAASLLHHPSIICLTETWLDQTKEQHTTLHGYNCYYSSRSGRIGGGVAIMVKKSLQSCILTSYTSKTLSAIWIRVYLSHRTLIVGCIYHPPNDAITNVEYIQTTIDQLLQNNKKANFILTGDFNRLDISGLCDQNGLKSLVNFPTRNTAKLDDILTDVECYDAAEKLAPIGTSDHCSIFVKGACVSEGSSQKYHYITRRDLRQHKKSALLEELILTDWNDVLQAKDVDSKVDKYYNIINNLLDKHCPWIKQRTFI